MSMDEYWKWLNKQNMLCELARTTKSLDTLKNLATSDNWVISYLIKKNPHSTEDVLLLAYAYNKFKKLTKWK